MEKGRRSQITAWLASGALHLLLAAALMLVLRPGGERHAKTGGQPLVVSLLPLDAQEAGGQPPTASGEARPMPATQLSPLVPKQARSQEATSHIAAPSTVEPGTSGDLASRVSSGADAQTYQQALLVHIERYRRYPDSARREHVEGVVLLRFLMDRNGKVLDAWIDRSSGFTILDTEAVAAVKRAQPLPVIPASLPDRLGIALPISFSLQ